MKDSTNITARSVTGIAFLLSHLLKEKDWGYFPTNLLPPHIGTPTNHPIVVIAPNRDIAQKLTNDASFFLHTNLEDSELSVLQYPAWEVLPFDSLSPARQVTATRIIALNALRCSTQSIIITTGTALMQRLMPTEIFEKQIQLVSIGDQISRDNLANNLFHSGYRKTALVEEPGDIAIRGAVIDVFPIGQISPVRIELFRGTIEAIREFSTETQRSVNELETVQFLPCREMFLPSDSSDTSHTTNTPEISISNLRMRASELHIPLQNISSIEEAIRLRIEWSGIEHLAPLLCGKYISALDYIPSNALIVTYDSTAIQQNCENYEKLIAERAQKAHKEGRIYPKPDDAYTTWESLSSWFDKKTELKIDSLAVLENNSKLQLDTKDTILEPHNTLRSQLASVRQSEAPFEPFAKQVKAWQQNKLKVICVSSTQQRRKRLIDLLSNYDLVAEDFTGNFEQCITSLNTDKTLANKILILDGAISEGFIAPAYGFAIVYERDLFPDMVPRRKTSPVKNVRRFLGALSQLKEGDYIVHIEHGVGLYKGLVQITVDGKIGDYLQLEYAQETRLYLPVENIAKIQKYVGVEGQTPALNKLGTKTWEKTREKVRQNVIELAGKLVNLYAEREIVNGYSFGDIDTLDMEFADTFPYEPTPDQQLAIDKVLEDMQSPRPMDRLVCGDVGYGKTEVALRAAVKAVSKNKQVALLVPTTVLAEQHYTTFIERFEGFPITVGCVSRFAGAKQNSDTLQSVKTGKIDVIIGTHRLLQKDVSFKDLGLVIIDEEHKFGVAHKERLKEFRKNVDVLTLTATPIPRTLHMSLLGIRDLSVIETPPSDRQVIQTYLAPYDQNTVREAILREVGRAGQVFYIHNRVQNIAVVADEIAELVPEARVAYGHGQMHEKELSEVMHRFINKSIDVLVCTTIVESGIDLPNANTIIIRNAERFGLADLYQLRGRVGRSARQAYAYLLISSKNTLGSEARKRLEVLQSLDDLGVGFRLALQDMEIRGAGNLLGKDQSGQVNSVGFDLYSQILKEAVYEVKRLQGDTPKASVAKNIPEVEPEIRIGYPAHMPPDYIPDVAERILLYQRLVELESDDAGRALLEEIEDRFGHPPNEVVASIEVMMLRSLLRRAGIVSLAYRNGWLTWSFHADVKLDAVKIVDAIRKSQGELKMSPSMAISAHIEETAITSPYDLMQFLSNILKKFDAIVLDKLYTVSKN